MVAEHRDVDAGPLGRVHHQGAGRHLDGLIIDQNPHRSGHPSSLISEFDAKGLSRRDV